MVNSLSLAGTVVFYFPLSQTRAGAETTKSIIKKIDYIGAILSMGALTLMYDTLEAREICQTDTHIESLPYKPLASPMHGSVRM